MGEGLKQVAGLPPAIFWGWPCLLGLAGRTRVSTGPSVTQEDSVSSKGADAYNPLGTILAHNPRASNGATDFIIVVAAAGTESLRRGS